MRFAALAACAEVSMRFYRNLLPPMLRALMAFCPV